MSKKPTTRLTNIIRNSIVDAALDFRFKAEFDALEEARRAFADDLYSVEFGDAEPIAKQLPEGWLSYGNRLCIEHQDYHRYRSGSDPIFQLSQARLIPDKVKYDGVEIGKDHLLFRRAAELAERESKLRDAKIELSQKLRALVHTFNTTGRLFEAWPEGAQFLPKDGNLSPGGSLVPRQLASEVNDILKLKEKAAE